MEGLLNVVFTESCMSLLRILVWLCLMYLIVFLFRHYWNLYFSPLWKWSSHQNILQLLIVDRQYKVKFWKVWEIGTGGIFEILPENSGLLKRLLDRQGKYNILIIIVSELVNQGAIGSIPTHDRSYEFDSSALILFFISSMAFSCSLDS